MLAAAGQARDGHPAARCLVLRVPVAKRRAVGMRLVSSNSDRVRSASLDSASRALVASYLAQVLLGAVQATIFAHFYRTSRHDYLRWWTWSFVGLCVYHACAAAALMWASFSAADLASRLILSWLSQVAFYVQVTLLLLGSLQIADARPRDAVVVRRLLFAAVVFGSAVSLAFAFAENGASERLWLRVGLRYLICGAAFMATAVLLWRQRVNSPGIGPAMVALAFSTYGLLLSFEFGLFVLQSAQQRRIDGAELLSVFDLVAQACIAFGLIIWVAEDERRRADRATRDVEHARRYDASTGLPNRVEMERLLQVDLQACAGNSLAVFAIDLVNLGQVAKSFGVHHAEAIFREASQRLLAHGGAATLRVARMDSHRLAVSVPAAEPAAEWERLALDWVTQLERPYDNVAAGVAIECTVGIAVGPGDGTDAASLLAHAEQSIHDPLQKVAFFSYERDQELRRRLAFAEESRAGLRSGQIVPFFQPIVASDGSAITGFEVLARWLHPVRGTLLPADFLGVLEDRGLMAQFDRHMLEQACRQAAGLRVPRISLNVSAYGFERDDFVADVRQALASSALPAECLCLEITESTALIDLSRTRDILLQLRALGIGISLDDFGTGYSSLAHLRELPIDTIKIDRVFVHAALDDVKTAAIVESVVTLARRLGLDIVIEGVEQRREFEYFRQLGATHFQGWLFAPAFGFADAQALTHIAAP